MLAEAAAAILVIVIFYFGAKIMVAHFWSIINSGLLQQFPKFKFWGPA